MGRQLFYNYCEPDKSLNLVHDRRTKPIRNINDLNTIDPLEQFLTSVNKEKQNQIPSDRICSWRSGFTQELDIQALYKHCVHKTWKPIMDKSTKLKPLMSSLT